MSDYPRTMDLAHWINERESMRLRREAGLPAPWTSDPIMSSTRWCNVRREDDKVTRFLRNDPVYSGPDVPLWVTVLSRMVNRIPTLETIRATVAVGDLTSIKQALQALKAEGRTVWGAAYLISTCGKRMDKSEYVVNWVVQAVMEAEGNEDFSSCQSLFDQLSCIDGLGSFLAAQVVADLKNTKGHPLESSPDWWTFVAHGPGSLKGLSAYWGHPVTPSTFKQHLTAMVPQVPPLLANYVPPLCMQNWQNCCCEISKYFRIQEGGRAKNSYHAS